MKNTATRHKSRDGKKANKRYRLCEYTPISTPNRCLRYLATRNYSPPRISLDTANHYHSEIVCIHVVRKHRDCKCTPSPKGCWRTHMPECFRTNLRRKRDPPTKAGRRLWQRYRAKMATENLRTGFDQCVTK